MFRAPDSHIHALLGDSRLRFLSRRLKTIESQMSFNETLTRVLKISGKTVLNKSEPARKEYFSSDWEELARFSEK